MDIADLLSENLPFGLIPVAALLFASALSVPYYIAQGRWDWYEDLKNGQYLALVATNMAGVCLTTYLSGRLHVEPSPPVDSFWWNFTLPILLIDCSIFFVHKVILHKTKWGCRIHQLHHSRVSGRDLHVFDFLYIHPLDAMLQHWIPVGVICALPLFPLTTVEFVVFGGLLFNFLVHSEIPGFCHGSHSQHHRGKDESYGIGMSIDCLYGSGRNYSMLCLTWTLLYASFHREITPVILVLILGSSWNLVFASNNEKSNYAEKNASPSPKAAALQKARDSYRHPLFWNFFYDALHFLVQGDSLSLMNWGFANITEDAKENDNNPSSSQSSIQLRKRLYTEVVQGVLPVVGVNSKKVGETKSGGIRLLEVGCGNGGGLSHLQQSLDLSNHDLVLEGVDFSAKNIQCASRRKGGGLVFRQDDAASLATCPTCHYDVVVNVESSHCYPDLQAFYASVERVLVPGGVFCYTDFIDSDKVEDMERLVQEAGFSLKCKRNITPNVLKSCRIQTAIIAQQYQGLAKVPGLGYIIDNFSNSPRSNTYKAFTNGQSTYIMYQFVKDRKAQ